MARPGNCSAAAALDDQLECIVGRFDESVGASFQLIAQASFRSGKEQALVGEPRRRIDPEIETAEMADRFRTDAHFSVRGDRDRESIGAARSNIANEDSRPAIDEALREPFMERIRKARGLGS